MSTVVPEVGTAREKSSEGSDAASGRARWIDRVIVWLAARFERVTPWLYAALCRALIPTIYCALVTALFFAVPQTREVLRGLSEPFLGSIHELNGHTGDGVNNFGLLMYVFTASLFAAALWRSGRFLLDHDFDRGRSNALTASLAGRTMLPWRWVARGLGIWALATAAGALIFANYTPQLPRLPALALATLSLVAPLCIAATLLRRWSIESKSKQWPHHKKRHNALLLAAACIVEVIAVVLLFVSGQVKALAAAWCLLASTLPGLLLTYQVLRRARLDVRTDIKDSSVTAAAPGADSGAFGHGIQKMTRMLVIPLGLLFLLAFISPSIVRRAGTAASVLLFLASSVVMCAFAQGVLRRIAKGIPGLTAAAIIVSTGLYIWLGDESLGVEKMTHKPSPQPSQATQSIASSAVPSGRLFVNAYGGGLRAALFTAESLARADDATCGKFGEEIIALSGVSGGSLGIGIYLVARQDLAQHGGWSLTEGQCDGTATPLTDIVRQVLVQDHLSVAIARMLAIDVTPLPIPPARGQALLDSWQSALTSALTDDDTDTAPPPGLALPLHELTGGISHRVQVYFNATNADTGHIVWFTNTGGGMVGTDQKERSVLPATFTVGEAVLHSARFPVVTPAGKYSIAWTRMPGKDAEPTTLRLVDGGYADNSGTTTLGRVARDLDANPTSSWLVNIDGNPPSQSACHKTNETTPVVTAVRALLEARAARAEYAVDEVDALLGPRIDLQLDLEKAYALDPDKCAKVQRAHAAPLGWYMSYGSASALEQSVLVSVGNMCDELDKGGLNLKCRLERQLAVANISLAARTVQ